jgi:hypothetical protein
MKLITCRELGGDFGDNRSDKSNKSERLLIKPQLFVVEVDFRHDELRLGDHERDYEQEHEG